MVMVVEFAFTFICVEVKWFEKQLIVCASTVLARCFKSRRLSWTHKLRCSYRTGDRTNVGQVLDKCPIFVQVLYNICPRFVNVQVSSNFSQINGQLSILCQTSVLILSNFCSLSKCLNIKEAKFSTDLNNRQLIKIIWPEELNLWMILKDSIHEIVSTSD